MPLLLWNCNHQPVRDLREEISINLLGLPLSCHLRIAGYCSPAPGWAAKPESCGLEGVRCVVRERAGGSSALVCLAWYHHPTTRHGEEGGVALASPSQVWKKQAPCHQARLALLPQLHCLLEVLAPRGRRQCGITWGFPGCILLSHHTELEDGTEGLTQICG